MLSPLKLFIPAQIALPTSTAKLTSPNFYGASALTAPFDATRTVRTSTCTRVYQTQFKKKKKNCFRKRDASCGTFPSLVDIKSHDVSFWQNGSLEVRAVRYNERDIIIVTCCFSFLVDADLTNKAQFSNLSCLAAPYATTASSMNHLCAYFKHSFRLEFINELFTYTPTTFLL